MFKGPAGFGRFNLAINVLTACIVLGFAIPLVFQAFTGIAILSPGSYAATFALTYCCGYTGGDLIPSAMWAQKLSDALNVRSGAIRYIINAVIIGAVMGTIILFLAGFVNNFAEGGFGAVWDFFSLLWLPCVIVSIVEVLIVSGIITKMAISVSGFDPAKAPAEVPHEL